MKIIRNIIIAIAIMFIIVYHGQTLKAQKINELRLRMSYREGKIAEEKYNDLIKGNTYFKNFFNPRKVLSVD